MPVAPAASESIERPRRGTLASGRWEAPAWMFVVVAVAAVVGALAWIAVALRTRKRR